MVLADAPLACGENLPEQEDGEDMGTGVALSQSARARKGECRLEEGERSQQERPPAAAPSLGLVDVT
jgi:hypothetical protein